MNPWHIIGWALVALMAIPILVGLWRLLARLRNWLGDYALHLRTRNDEPKPGDTWVQNGYGSGSLHITHIADNGRICIKAGAASWSDSPDEWRQRVRNRRARRVLP